MSAMGIIIIGRNEGSRLRQCLCSVRRAAVPAVYVDSGSTDGSVELAASILGHVVELDRSRPFTAARGRNEGFHALVKQHPDVVFIQFLDGDCELDDQWMPMAARHLLSNPNVAIVCGRLRERHRQSSMYNRLCDMEWNGPVGSIEGCGGIFMMRAEVFQAVNGFDSSIAAGEEPELCCRVRQRGWSIERIKTPMATHDAAIQHFGQWWWRATRSGRGSMQSAIRRTSITDTRDLRRVGSSLFWAAIIPLIAVAGLMPTGGWSVLVLSAYPLQWWRIYSLSRRRGLSHNDCHLAATFLLIAKFAGLVGIVQHILAGARSRSRPTAKSNVQQSLAHPASRTIGYEEVRR